MFFSKSGRFFVIKLSEHHRIEPVHRMRVHTKLTVDWGSHHERHLSFHPICSQQAYFFRFLQILYLFRGYSEGDGLHARLGRLFLEFLHRKSPIFLIMFVDESSSRRIKMESFGSFVERVELFVDQTDEFKPFLPQIEYTSIDILLYLRLEFFYSSENDIAISIDYNPSWNNSWNQAANHYLSLLFCLQRRQAGCKQPVHSPSILSQYLNMWIYDCSRRKTEKAPSYDFVCESLPPQVLPVLAQASIFEDSWTETD